MRIDKFLSREFGSRTKAAEAINDGLVLVNGRRVSPSHEVGNSDDIRIIQREEQFVSNGGYKLSKALSDFGMDVSGMTIADIGASNGGFTDCLFKRGAKKVYCIDVGNNQLDPSLAQKNIVVIDNFNARELSRGLFEEALDGVVVDVSFISLTYILGRVSEILDSGKFVIALIKPQFELEGGRVGKRGVLKDASLHKKVIKKIYDFADGCSLSPCALTNAPIKEGKNKEYLIKLVKDGQKISFQSMIKYVKL